MEDGELMEILREDDEPEVNWGDLDFYDGVEEKEEKERMEDRGVMEHEPRGSY